MRAEPPSSPTLLPREKGARIQSPSPWGEGFRVRAKLTLLTIDIGLLYPGETQNTELFILAVYGD
jgi:hypothetical protein